MAWIGWTAGMSGPPVKMAKRELKRKFQYAQFLDDTEFFGLDLQMVLAEYQKRKNVELVAAGKLPLREDGVLDYATRGVLGILDPAKPVLFTVHGTGVTMNDGYPADCARALVDSYRWQPIGNYPAAVFPMGPSVKLGRAELVKQIAKHPGAFAMVGYSQGAMVVTEVFKHDIRNPGGILHHRLRDLIAVVTFGNPHREQGHTYPSDPSPPTGRGIGDDLLVDTPDYWWDFAQSDDFRDIYTNVPNDGAGEHMTAIFRLVQNVSCLMGKNGLLEQMFEISQDPVSEILDAFRAVYYGGQFVAYRPATLPHISYDIRPAVDYLRRVVKDQN